jgi:hypothetical protein
VQLFLVQLKKNHTHLIFWLILLGIITQNIAAKYGAPFLFLEPEYLNEVSPLSYFIMGFASGGFIMAYNITSYVMNGFRFPFLATVVNPFGKFCVNNAAIPLLFVIVYCCNCYSFLMAEKIFTTAQILIMLLGFIGGLLLFVMLSVFYFQRTNKDIYKLHGKSTQEAIAKPRKSKRLVWRNPLLIKESRDWYVETYVGSYLKFKMVRPVNHYKREMIRSVFKQNHRNAAKFGLTALVSLVLLGLFQEYDLFMIPAGASVLLLFTMFLMLSSFLYGYFRGWASVVLILLFLTLNYFFKTDFTGTRNKAYGLNYNCQPAEYSYNTLSRFATDEEKHNADTAHQISILQKWKYVNLGYSLQSSTRPKLVFVNTSGGGLRSSLWTFYVLQYADSLSHGDLLKHIHLITGSSGGMIGAAYLRELYWQKQKEGALNIYSDSYIHNISKDILNPVAFSIATNELFLGIPKFTDGNYTYPKDRAYSYEKQLNENTSFLLDKRLADYIAPEQNAKIPMMIFAPSIANDGRQLLISSQPVSFLTRNIINCNLEIPLTPAVEFTRLFDAQDAMNTKFTSVLRMNATFPYISPIVRLPSNPVIEVMDAGMIDNYGLFTTVKYIEVFKKWIEQETSGIIILQIRDKHKQRPIEENPNPTLIQSFTKPMNSFYGNIFSVQDFNQNRMLEMITDVIDVPIEVLNFELQNEKSDNISLSWHLTNREKEKVLNSIHDAENKKNLLKLMELLR